MSQEFQAIILHFLETAWIPIVEVVGSIIIGPKVKKLIVKMAQKSNDKGIMTFLGSAANLLIIFIGFIMAAEALGVKMSNVIALVSALGLGVSLALKSNMANVAGGLQILMTKPFKIGDYIKISGHRGYVETIELMFTTIRTDNEKLVVIPNSTVVSDIVTNYSNNPYVRVKAKFTVAVGKDFETIRENVEKIVRGNPWVLQDHQITVVFSSIVSGYVKMEAIAYVNVSDYEKCRHQMLEDIVLKMPLYTTSSTPSMNVKIIEEKPDPQEVEIEANAK